MPTVTRSSGMLEGTTIEQKYIELDAQRDAYQLVSAGLITPCNGKGFSVDKGQVFRIVQIDGPQVGDYAVPMTEPDKITTRPLGFEIYNT